MSARLEHSHGYITSDDVYPSGCHPGPTISFMETFQFSQPLYVTQRTCGDAFYLSRELSFSYIDLRYPVRLEALSLRSCQTSGPAPYYLFSNLRIFTHLELTSYRRGGGPLFPLFGEIHDGRDYVNTAPSQPGNSLLDAMLCFYGLQKRPKGHVLL